MITPLSCHHVNSQILIRIFRFTRKTMLQQGKFSDYLRYAVGEVFLVVIGILIALQINNWNEQRKLNASQVTYLPRDYELLIDDPKFHSILVEKWIFNTQTCSDVIDPLLEHANRLIAQIQEELDR
jgi:hypothetical protein